MNCKYCGKSAVYKCSACGKTMCGVHTKLRTVCLDCIEKTTLEYIISKVDTGKERKKIQEFVQHFWGEEEQLTFDHKFTAAELPAYTAKVKNHVTGFISFAEANDSIIIVALGMLPQYQGSSVGKDLVEKVTAEAKRLRKKRVLVSTSNDDVPALVFYQSIGFQIYEVKPNVIAEKHGEVMKGIGGLPIRDELRLQKLVQ